MRTALLILALTTTSACGGATLVSPAAVRAQPVQLVKAPVSSSLNSTNDFQTKVKPILEAHCLPCHFQGGKMYERLPFDRPETITKLGEKLFTRIKDKDEQRVIREFLAQTK